MMGDGSTDQRSTSRVWVMTCVAAAALSACTTMERAGRAVLASGPFVATNNTDDLAAKLSPHMRIQKPVGEGPFPTVIQFHGCGGLVAPNGELQPILQEYGEAATGVGVAVVTVDSFAHRGIDRATALKSVCSGRSLRGAERAGDVLAALAYVRTLEFVDPERIVLAGWSHGGWSVMDLLSMDLKNRWPAGLNSVPDDPMRGVVGAHLTYPYASFPARTKETGWAWPVDARFVLAGDDTVAPEADVRAAIAKVFETQEDAQIEVFEIKGVTHAFDERYLEPGSSLVFDEDEAAKARAAYADWLARVFAQDSGEAEAATGRLLFAAADGPRGKTPTRAASVTAARTASEPPSAAAGDYKTYQVEDGDTLWAIAERHFGEGVAYRLIVHANRDMIADEDLIFPGQTLRLPHTA